MTSPQDNTAPTAAGNPTRKKALTAVAGAQ